jgi:hypothetical protein
VVGAYLSRLAVILFSVDLLECLPVDPLYSAAAYGPEGSGHGFGHDRYYDWRVIEEYRCYCFGELRYQSR